MVSGSRKAMQSTMNTASFSASPPPGKPNRFDVLPCTWNTPMAGEPDGDGVDGQQVRDPGHRLHPAAATEAVADGRADDAGLAFAVGVVGDHQCSDGVDAPSVQRPVEVGNDHRVSGGRPARQMLLDQTVVGQGLGGAVEQQPHAHSGGEQLGEPADGRELRAVLVRAEAHIAVGREREPEHQHHDQAGYQHDEPGAAAELLGDFLLREGRESGGVQHPPRAPPQRSSRGRSRAADSSTLGRVLRRFGDGRTTSDEARRYHRCAQITTRY